MHDCALKNVSLDDVLHAKKSNRKHPFQEASFTVFEKFVITTAEYGSIHKLKFDVYQEARQSSQLCSPDRFRCFW